MKGGEVMDINVIVDIVKNVGFPIAICGVLFWYIYHITENHKLESEKFTEAINNNTLVIQKLVDKLENE